jgi:hypothetical protein
MNLRESADYEADFSREGAEAVHSLQTSLFIPGQGFRSNGKILEMQRITLE